MPAVQYTERILIVRRLEYGHSRSRKYWSISLLVCAFHRFKPDPFVILVACREGHLNSVSVISVGNCKYDGKFFKFA